MASEMRDRVNSIILNFLEVGSEDTIETQRPFWVIAGTRLKMVERVVVQHSFRAGDRNPFECAQPLARTQCAE